LLRERLHVVCRKFLHGDARDYARFSDALWREMDLECGPDDDQNSDPDGR
jgi:hypothetical protein